MSDWAEAAADGTSSTAVAGTSLVMFSRLLVEAAEAGVRDAAAGAPDPNAETIDGSRQPAARLLEYASRLASGVPVVAERALVALSEVERLSTTLPRLIVEAESAEAVAAAELARADKGKERELGHWRLTIMMAAIGVGLPFEVYLTQLSLKFLEATRVEVRLMSVGVAVALALSGVVAVHARPATRTGEDEKVGVEAIVLFWVVVVLLFGLGMLRWGVISDGAKVYEKFGGAITLGITAGIFALWSGFVAYRIRIAAHQHDAWRVQVHLEKDIRELQEQESLLRERLHGLGAEIESCRAAGAEQVRAIPSHFDAVASAWWAAYQEANAKAAPDVRGWMETTRTPVAAAAAAAVERIDARAHELRRALGSTTETPGGEG